MDEELHKPDSTDPDRPVIPEEEMQKLVSAMTKTLEMGIGAVYGHEEDGVPDSDVDCIARLQQCKSVCCTFQFALTKDEVQKGLIKYNTKRPFFIARDKDGYCPHLKRDTFRCSVWNKRPLRCRRYNCSDDPQVWSGPGK